MNIPKIQRDLDKAIGDYEEILRVLENLQPGDIEYNATLARKQMLKTRIAMLREWLRG